MARLHQYHAAARSTDPVVIELAATTRHDGHRFEFPPDVDAGAWIEFVRKFGGFLDDDLIPAKIVVPMLELLIGDRVEELTDGNLGLDELRFVMGVLWQEWINPEGPTDDDGGATNPER